MIWRIKMKKTRLLHPISRKLPQIKRMYKKDFEVVAPEILAFEAGLWPKPERWDSGRGEKGYQQGLEDFREVYGLPHAARFGAYANTLVGFTLGMPTDVAREIYREDDGSPTDKFELIPDKQGFLWVIEVAKAYQGRGVGKSLLNRVAEATARKGADWLYCYLREPIPRLCGRDVEVITPVKDYAGTGKTYYLSTMNIFRG